MNRTYSNEYPVLFKKKIESYCDYCPETIKALDLSVNKLRARRIARSLTDRVDGKIPITGNEFHREFLRLILLSSVLIDLYKSSSLELLNLLAQYQPNLARAIRPLSGKNRNDTDRVALAFKVRLQKQDNDLNRTILVVSSPQKFTVQHDPDSVAILQFVFGNIDLFILPPHFQDMWAKNDFLLLHCGQKALSFLSARCFATIARYLDMGQMLNLAELKANHAEFGSKERSFSIDPYMQYLNDFTYYSTFVPNRHLMTKRPQKTLYVMHQTAHKKEILESQTLKVSKAGCIGNRVYTTELVGKGINILGGHAIGLHRRKHPNQALSEDDWILMKVKKQGNTLTNWIEKLGRGVLATGALKAICEDYPAQHAQISQKAFDQYVHLYPIFEFLNLYATSIKKILVEDEGFSTKAFAVAKQLLLKGATMDGKPSPSLLNGIFFEIIKDYILLFQSDKDSIKFRKKLSFNMDNQYRIFFKLAPQLKKDWDTGQFPIDFDRLFAVLRKKKLIKTDKDEVVFKNFFLDRLFCYINIGCLQGCQTLPHPSHIESLEDILFQIPNLGGLLYDNAIKQLFQGTPLLETYLECMRILHQARSKERKLDVAVKAGISRTEEVGLAPTANVQFLNFSFQETEGGFHEVKEQEEIKNLTINGVSNTNGFTNRSTI